MRLGEHNYILNEAGVPVNEPNMARWGQWLVEHEELRRVAQIQIGPVRVSTVFLALDHGWGHSEQPVLWETMVFGGRHDGSQWRYTSRAAAEEGHKRAVFMVQEEAQTDEPQSDPIRPGAPGIQPGD